MSAGKFKLSKLHIVTLLGGFAVIIGATAAGKGIGTFCNLCPVGFLQITAAARAIPTGVILGVVVGLMLVYVLGRFFCSWLCTTAMMKTTFLKERKVKPLREAPVYLKYLPFGILGLALVVSFIVQFPVFCLVCPIGLFFGFIYAVFKLLHIFEPGWSLIVFPAILAVEILLFRKWCTYICPISAVFTLLGKIPGPKLRLKVNKVTCLLSKGVNCKVCANTCPEGIHITEHNAEYVEYCTTCMECRDHCPTQSIGYKTPPPSEQESA